MRAGPPAFIPAATGRLGLLAAIIALAWSGAAAALELVPTPKELTLTGGVFEATGPLAVVTAASIPAADANGAGILVERLTAAGVQARQRAGRRPPPRNFVVFDGFDEFPVLRAAGVAVSSPLPPEGYLIEVRPEGVYVAAADRRGMVWAAVTLGQLASQGPLPLGRIVDHPSVGMRLAHIMVPARQVDGTDVFANRTANRTANRNAAFADLPDAAAYLPLVEGYVQDALDHKFNGAVIELNGAFRFRSHPELAVPEAVELAALAPLVARMERWYADPIPLLSVLSHQEQLLAESHPDWMLARMGEHAKVRTRGGMVFWESVADMGRPEVREVVADCLDEAVDLFRPRFVHIGHDEAGALRFVPRENDDDVVGLFADSVRFAHDRLAARGVRTMMWGDMLLDGHRFPGAAHGGEQGAPTWQAAEKLPRDIVIVDWQYYPVPRPWPEQGAGRSDVPSAAWLSSLGFDVVGATWLKPTPGRHDGVPPFLVRHGQRLSAHVASLPHGTGMMTTQWTPGPWLARALEEGGVPSILVSAEQFWNAGRTPR